MKVDPWALEETSGRGGTGQGVGLLKMTHKKRGLDILSLRKTSPEKKCLTRSPKGVR